MPRPPMRRLGCGVFFGLVLATGACSRPPESATPPSGPAPVIQPLEGLLAQAGAGVVRSDPAVSLNARAAGLRLRANVLRDPVQAPGR